MKITIDTDMVFSVLYSLVKSVVFVLTTVIVIHFIFMLIAITFDGVVGSLFIFAVQSDFYWIGFSVGWFSITAINNYGEKELI